MSCHVIGNNPLDISLLPLKLQGSRLGNLGLVLYCWYPRTVRVGLLILTLILCVSLSQSFTHARPHLYHTLHPQPKTSPLFIEDTEEQVS